MVNLYKLAHTQAKNANDEEILRILNDSLQGTTVGLGFLLGGTPDFLLDTRRGLYSYQALQSRLSENSFAGGSLVDLSGPVLRLANLTPEDLFVLLGKIRNVYAAGDPRAYLLPDEALTTFMTHCSQRVGEAYFRTPRTTITAFVNLLAVLEQNPTVSWRDLIGDVEVVLETNPDLTPVPDEAIAGAPESQPPRPGEGTAPSGDDDLALFSSIHLGRVVRLHSSVSMSESGGGSGSRVGPSSMMSQERAIEVILDEQS